MATDGGPNIERDGLVFGMDTGYGVANNSTSTRFYKGKPTVNYVPGTYGYGMYAYASGPVDDTAQNENGQVVPVKRYTIYQASNTARAAIRPDTNTTDYHTFSFKWKYNGTTTTSPSISVSAAKGNPEGGENNNGFEYQTGDTISIGKNWYLSTYTFKFSSNPTGKCILTFGINTGSNQSYLGETFDIYEAQFELKDRVTPFVNGTRSSTQSLIDLTKSANIDVSNVSFDSTGQPIYDGTNDYIDIINYTQHQRSTGTIEAVVKLGTISGNRYIFGAGGTFTYGATRALRVNSGYWGIVTYGSGTEDWGTGVAASTTDWQHVAFGWDGTTVYFYINGVRSSTTRSGLVTPLGTTLRIGMPPWSVGSASDGQIAVIKHYSTVLTESEIKQNYNAYKNRFNL